MLPSTSDCAQDRNCVCYAGEDAGSIQSFAWDVAGERLAVALNGSDRRIAVFATAHKPILSLRLLGTVPMNSGGVLTFQ